MYRSFRAGIMLASLVGVLALATPASAAADHTAGPYVEPTYNIIIGAAGYDRTFYLTPLALFDEQPPAVTQRSYQTFKTMPVKTHTVGAAILATSKAGWGSGRLRKLAG